MIHPNDRVGLEVVIERAIQAEGELESRELRLRFKDGIWHWVNISAVHIEYQGKPALQITFNDISDRKQAEQALDQQQQYSSAILNTVDALVMILDRSRTDHQLQSSRAAHSPLGQPGFIREILVGYRQHY